MSRCARTRIRELQQELLGNEYLAVQRADLEDGRVGLGLVAGIGAQQRKFPVTADAVP
jgi:hypothetical protein